VETESECIGHEPCPSCGSSDNLGRYSDGHGYCFGCHFYERGAGELAASGPRGAKVDTTDFLEVTPVDLVKRCISEEICRKFGYGTAVDHNGKTVQVASYRDEHGRVVAQKIRTANKKFSIVGDAKAMRLFGQHLWQAGGRRVVVVEGEIDCLSVAAATGGTWPVVSLPNGASSARKAIANNIEWLSSFESCVLCFDNDEAGQAAVAECAPLLPPGKCAIVTLPRKDANELLVAGEVKQLSQLLWQGRIYRPDGIVGIADVRERVLEAPEMGRPWPFEGLTQATYGRRLCDVIGFGGGTGCGKTDLFTTIIAHDILTLGITCGVIYLEQPVEETVKRITGKIAGRTFHLPDGSWTQEELERTLDSIPADKLHLYDNFGAMDWETISSRIRYMAVSLGCEHIFLDHLTALAAGEDDERRALEQIMAKMSALAKELRIIIHYVSHLATPESGSHEEGSRVLARHFKGSRAIIFWSHALFGLERDTQKPGEPTTLRCLKDRNSGRSLGKTWGLGYDSDTGRLYECELSGDHEFRDETRHDDGGPGF
jgi:twinkle protein